MRDVLKLLPPLNALVVLVTVSESQTFAEAATKLIKTDGAIRESIKMLEGHVGETLVVRGKKSQPLTLTPAGVDWTRRARGMIRALKADQTAGNTNINPLDLSDIDQRSLQTSAAWELIRSSSFKIADPDDQNNPLVRSSVLLSINERDFFFRSIGQESTWRQNVGGRDTDSVINRPCSEVGDIDAQTSAALFHVYENGSPLATHVRTDVKTLTNGEKTFSYDRLTAIMESPNGPLLLITSVMEDTPPTNRFGKTTAYTMPDSVLSEFDGLITDYLVIWRDCALWYSNTLLPFHDIALCTRQIPNTGDLIMYHVGEDSEACKYFGEKWRQDSIGKMFSADNIGTKYNNETGQGHLEVLQNGGPIFDMIVSEKVNAEGVIEIMSQFRVLTRCLLNDFTPISVGFLTTPRIHASEADIFRSLQFTKTA